MAAQESWKIKLALHTVSFSGIWRGQPLLEVEQILAKAKELGFDGIMLGAKRPHVSPLDYDAEAREGLLRRVRELGLEVACIAAYTDFTAGIDRPGTPVTEIQVLYVSELARLARDLDCPRVRIFTGYERAEVPFDRQWGMVVEGIRESARRAAEYGVTLLVQNHHDLGVHHDAMHWLLEEIGEPNCQAGFDAWSPALHGCSSQEIAAAVQKLAPYIAYTTVADYQRLPRFSYLPTLVNFERRPDRILAAPMGTGFIDYAVFFQALREIGYSGYVAYEICEVIRGGGSEANLDRCAAQFVSYMNRLRR